ncbi:MAG: glycerol-3-phosphate acyltransferase [Alphaproteobacteria bacterium]|nr:glycerol-3-phosphate acyltransferase [Alphaproteobacteria bacterium]
MPDPLGSFEHTWRLWLAAPLIGYLLGSIPFGVVLTRLAGYGDIRAIGSGNIGATNVLRTGNKALALLTLVLDAAKGGAPAWLAVTAYGQDFGVMVALGTLFGHMHSIWLAAHPLRKAAALAALVAGFALLAAGGLTPRTGLGLAVLLASAAWAWGGKGVATALGGLIALAWPVGLASCALWLAIAVAFRYSSLASLSALLGAPVLAVWLADRQITEFAIFLAALILIRHAANIARLIRGTESKIVLSRAATAGRPGKDKGG